MYKVISEKNVLISKDFYVFNKTLKYLEADS